MTIKNSIRTSILAVLLFLQQGSGSRSDAADTYGAAALSGGPMNNQLTAPYGTMYNPLSGPSYPVAQDSYFTDDFGNILMVVNVLGEVGKPGQFIVRENVDFATIFALSGGLKPEANIRKVVVARREPDLNGRQAYVLDLKSYFKTGDRSSFIALKPNDTVIIPQNGISLDKIAHVMSIAYPLFYIYDAAHRNN